VKRIVPTLATVVALAAASPALGAEHTLGLSGPATAFVGEPVVFDVSGTAAPPAEYWALSWIDVYAIPPSVVSACPVDDGSAAQLATRAGGAILTIAMRPNKDAAGNFANQVGATPSAPGTILICAYTVNEEGLTLSRASRTLTIRDGVAEPSDAEPRNLQRPLLSHARNRLVCSPGVWSSAVRGYSYRWLVNGTRVRGARRRTLAVTARLRGRPVRCRVTASNAAGATTALSAPLRIGARS
jgi:hypothetical protein